MMHRLSSRSRRAEVNFWPGLLDLVTSVLMVFLLISLLQTLSIDDLEVIVARLKQSHFLNLFNQRFATEVEQQIVKADPHLSFVQITFSDRVLFLSGEYQLQPEGRTLLSRLASLLEEAGETGFEQIQVEGHTDNRDLNRREYPRNNWELASARAIDVALFLREESASVGDVFSANGYADNRPIADNETVEGRAQNRRIEIRLFFSGARSS